MPTLTLQAGDAGLERKYSGKFIFVREATGALLIEVNGDVYECQKGSWIGPIEPGFTTIKLTNAHTVANDLDLEVSQARYGENLLIFDSGTEEKPLIVRAARDQSVWKANLAHALAAGKSTCFFIRPDPDAGIYINSISLYSDVELDLGSFYAVPATVDAELIWSSVAASKFSSSEISLAPPAINNAAQLVQNIALGVSATSDNTGYNHFAIMPAGTNEMKLHTPVYVPAGGAIGWTFNIRNRSVLPGTLSATIWGELA